MGTLQTILGKALVNSSKPKSAYYEQLNEKYDKKDYEKRRECKKWGGRPRKNVIEKIPDAPEKTYQRRCLESVQMGRKLKI